MAENKLNTRVKKTLESSKELAKATRDHVGKEKDKILEIFTNTLVDRKIEEKETKLKALSDLYDDNEVDAINTLKSDEALEKQKLSEDYKSIVKKQLQILQADERGKQALLNEISEIKQQQRKRSEALKARKKALLIEKERSQRIAALPPPIPRSVKLLLKEQEKKKAEASSSTNSFVPQELDIVEEVFEDSENKENMDEAYYEQRGQMQIEWDRKAKRRFHDALRKDRQKQEHAQILKEIENAEKTSRRQMAKNVSEPSGKVPSTLSDRLNHIEKQAVLEDAVESVYKKSSCIKEHAIEDLEGYEDKWEAKYKQIDSNLESKLIDCIPSFVQHNYSYLLEEEPARQCGNRFTRLNDGNDELNMAYIESPTEPMSSSDQISAVVTHLEQMMSESNEVYEKEFKPLLDAENLKGALPKSKSSDKAVETHILKLPTEDKATEVCEEISSRNETPFATRSSQADFMSSGVMAFKRRKHKAYLGNLSGPGTQSPSWVEPEAVHSNEVSWTSSSYYSLPPKHGQPDICKLCDSPRCRLPLVEDGSLHRDCIPLSKNPERGISHLPETSDSELTEVRSKISSYIQLVAEKHLKKVSHESESQEGLSSVDDIAARPDATSGIITGYLSDLSVKESAELLLPSSDVVVEEPAPGTTRDKIPQKSKSQQMVLPQIPPYSDKKPVTETDKPMQNEFMKRCHEILTERLSNFFSIEDGSESEVLSVLKSAILEDASEEISAKVTPGEFVYHELSTILEMDSALTNVEPSLQDMSKRADISGSSSKSSLSIKSGLISPEKVDTTSVSLVDAPNSEASELAKNILFVAQPSGKSPESAADKWVSKSDFSLISGTLYTTATPSPHVVSENLIPESAAIAEHQQVSRSTAIIIEKPSGSAPEVLEHESLITGPLSTIHSSESVIFGPLSTIHTPESIVSGPLSTIHTQSQSVFSEALQLKLAANTEFLNTPSSTTISDVQSNISIPSTIKTSRSGFSSRDLLTPSSQLSTHSQQSEESHVTPLSSSNRFANRKHPFLTNLINTLPEYFRNVSSIDQGTSESSKSAVNIKPIDDRQTIPKSANVRGPSKQILKAVDLERFFEQNESSSHSFKPMTPHTYISSPGTTSNEHNSKSAGLQKNLQDRVGNLPNTAREPYLYAESSQGSFKPMTPQLSTHSQQTEESHVTPLSSSYRFANREHPFLTNLMNTLPEYFRNVSSIDQGTSESSRSAENIKPIDDRNSISKSVNVRGPSKQIFKAVDLVRFFEENESSSHSFKPMTPHTYISSPGTTSNEHNSKFAGLQKNLQDRVGNLPNTAREEPYLYAESSEGSFKPMTPRSYMSSPVESPYLRGQHNTFRGSEDKYPDPKASSDRKSIDSQGTDDSNYLPMTSHSNISTPNLSDLKAKGSQHKTKKLERDYTSTESQSSQFEKRNWRTAEDTISGFQPMTPHSHISTPNLYPERHRDFDSNIKHKAHSTSEREHLAATESSTGSFQPMTSHSNISTPNFQSQGNQNFDSQKNYGRPNSAQDREERYSVNTENSANGFQPMTSHSDISVPSSNTNISSEEDLRHHSSSLVNLKLRIPRNLIGDTSLEPTTSGSNAPEISDSENGNPAVGSHASYKSLRLKFDIKSQNYMNPDADLEDYLVGDGPHLQQELLIHYSLMKKGMASSIEKSSVEGYMSGSEAINHGVKDANKEHRPQVALKVPRSDIFIPQLSSTDLVSIEGAQTSQQDRKSSKKATKVCSSDFFVPQLSSNDLPSSQARPRKGYFSCDLTSCPEISSEGGSECLNTPSVSSVMSSERKSTNDGEPLKSVSRSLKGGSGSLSPSISSASSISVGSPNPILEALRRQFASNSSSKASSLIASPCNSQEALCDISVSKANYQSTPIKTIEEIIQETGIMDEPDLTLIPNEFTIKPESPERTRLFSEKSIVKEDTLPISNAVPNTDMSAGLPKTPTAVTSASYAESPSMMSFLQHEMSCFADPKMKEHSDLTDNSVSENVMHEDDCGKFAKNPPKYEYKKRTKRLWNNLEEVQTRKMMEEKKKKSAENRLKMKAYSKVYNPSKKTPDH